MAGSDRVSEMYSTTHVINVPICTLKHPSYVIIANDSPRYKLTFLSLAFITTEKIHSTWILNYLSTDPY
jgi:hypothetical protein